MCSDRLKATEEILPHILNIIIASHHGGSRSDNGGLSSILIPPLRGPDEFVQVIRPGFVLLVLETQHRSQVEKSEER